MLMKESFIQKAFSMKAFTERKKVNRLFLGKRYCNKSITQVVRHLGLLANENYNGEWEI